MSRVLTDVVGSVSMVDHAFDVVITIGAVIVLSVIALRKMVRA